MRRWYGCAAGLAGLFALVGCGDAPPVDESDAGPILGDAGGGMTEVFVTVTVDFDGDGEGSVSLLERGDTIGTCAPTDAPCTFQVLEGSALDLVATEVAPSRFGGWSGPLLECPGTDPACGFVAAIDTTATATFLLDDYAVRVAAEGNGSGLVVSDPGAIDCGETCLGIWEAGTTVLLTATPDPSSELTGWGGACEGVEGDTCEVTLTDADLDVTVTFTLRRYEVVVQLAGDGAGVVEEPVAGIDCGDACSVEVDHGTMLAPVATPDPTSVFGGFEGCMTADPCGLVVTGPVTLVATFDLAPRALSVELSGSGEGSVASDPAGISCGTDCDEVLLHGATVVLTATADEESSSFTGWSGACSGTDPICTVAMNEARDVTATFTLLDRTLSVEKRGAGAGTVTAAAPADALDCGDTCSVDVPHGTRVTLTATPDSATSRFTGWGGECSGAAPTCEVTLDRARRVIARFELRRRTLTVELGGTGDGDVTSAPTGVSCGGDCEGTYDHGTEVTLTAAPDSATSSFTGWSGACTGTSRTCRVTMDGALRVTATFALLDRALTVDVDDGTGSGTVTATSHSGIACPGDCTEDFPHGTMVTLRAAPDRATSSFSRWTGACTGSAATCTVTMDRARTARAVFTLLERRLTVAVDGGTGTGTVTSTSHSGISCGSDCAEDYDHGTVVTLRAAANTATSSFTRWTGACTGSAATCTVTMDRARTVTAVFTLLERRLTADVDDGTGTGTVEATSHAGLDCPGDCVEDFSHGTVVTLQATATAATSRFAGWSGACTGTSRTCTVTMDRARTVRATFTLLDRTLTVRVRGNGTGTVTSSPAGISCASGDCSDTFPHGTSVTLTAAPDRASSLFAGWSGACSGTGSCTVSMTAARTVTATFTAIDRRLTVDTDGGTGTGTVDSTSHTGLDCPGDCAEDFPHGTVVTLRAIATTATSVFAGWSGACAGTSRTCTVTMDRARSVVAIFNLAMRPLTVRVRGNGSGTVTSSPAGISCTSGDCETDYAHGTSVTLTAAPNRGSSFFAGWSGACSGTGTCTVSMTAARTVTATFTAFDRRLTVERGGPGTVTSSPAGITCGPDDVDCTEDYPHGTSVRLTASPDGDSIFVGWGGACTGTATTCTVSMTAARTVSATFRVRTYPLQVDITRFGIGTGTVTSRDGRILRCSGSCSASYESGTSVVLTRAVGTNSRFLGWTGACSGTGSTCTVTMDRARSVGARFAPALRTLTVRVTGIVGTSTVSVIGGGGTRTCTSGCTASYEHGTSITVSVTLRGASYITDWGGSCDGRATRFTTCNVVMDTNRVISVDLDDFI